MGGLTCAKTIKPEGGMEIVENNKLQEKKIKLGVPVERLLKIEIPGESILGLSFSQRRFKGFKGLWEFDHQRILAITPSKIFLFELLDPTTRLYKVISTYSPPLQNTTFIYGAFVDDNNSNYFVAVVSFQSKYFIRTYKVIQPKSKGQVEDAPIRVGGTFYRESKQNSAVPLGLGKEKFGYVVKLDPSKYSRDPSTGFQENEVDPNTGESLCKIEQYQEQELQACSDKSIALIRFISNPNHIYTELLIVTAKVLYTVFLKHKKIIKVLQEKCDKAIQAIEYLEGYYIFLCAINSLVIYKRGNNDNLQEVQHIELSFPDFPGEFTFTNIKIPALNWTDRHIGFIQNQIPKYIILSGNFIGKDREYKCLMNYDMRNREYSKFALIESQSRITSINYGPYDNGPIIVGFHDGTVMGFDYYTLEKLLQVKSVENEQIKFITYEPCKTIVVGSTSSILTYSMTSDLFLYIYMDRIGNEIKVIITPKK